MGVHTTLLNLEFDQGTITQVRHLVEESAEETGLEGTDLEDFVLAVHEAVTNAVRYGTAPWEIALWRDAGVLRCQVTDQGPGIPPEVLNRDRAIIRYGYGGRGLWLMNRLVDMDIQTGPEGTTVQLDVPLP